MTKSTALSLQLQPLPELEEQNVALMERLNAHLRTAMERMKRSDEDLECDYGIEDEFEASLFDPAPAASGIR